MPSGQLPELAPGLWPHKSDLTEMLGVNICLQHTPEYQISGKEFRLIYPNPVVCRQAYTAIFYQLAVERFPRTAVYVNRMLAEIPFSIALQPSGKT